VAATPANGRVLRLGLVSTAGRSEVLPSTFVSVRVGVEPGIGGVATVLALSFKFALGCRRGSEAGCTPCSSCRWFRSKTMEMETELYYVRHLKHWLIPSPPPALGMQMPVVVKEGDDSVRFRLPYSASSKIILASGTIAVPAPTSSRAAVTPFTSVETKGLIILDWTTGAFLCNPIAAASTPIIGLDSTVSSDAAREGMSGKVVGDDNKATSRSARSCSACETLSSLRFFCRFDSKTSVVSLLNSISNSRLASGAVFLASWFSFSSVEVSCEAL